MHGWDGLLCSRWVCLILGSLSNVLSKLLKVGRLSGSNAQQIVKVSWKKKHASCKPLHVNSCIKSLHVKYHLKKEMENLVKATPFYLPSSNWLNWTDCHLLNYSYKKWIQVQDKPKYLRNNFSSEPSKGFVSATRPSLHCYSVRFVPWPRAFVLCLPFKGNNWVVTTV